jgi:hypothetical protein
MVPHQISIAPTIERFAAMLHAAEDSMDASYKVGRITLPRLGRYLRYRALHMFAPIGRLPDVVIVGAMKGGTTSLFAYLCQHPEVHGSIKKEVHYFDRNFCRGEAWYRRHFTRRHDGLVLEGTPDYMFHKSSFERLQEMLPKARIIVLLRNPATRAYSHYHHMRVKTTETRSFEEAVRTDFEWYRERGVLGDDTWQSNDHSYVRRGIYAPQVRRILNAYAESALILRSEDLFADPLVITNRVLRFVGLTELRELTDVEPKTAGTYQRTIPMRQELEEFFSPHNDELYQLLQVNDWWPRARMAPRGDKRAAA